jgi:hypothetical protein
MIGEPASARRQQIPAPEQVTCGVANQRRDDRRMEAREARPLVSCIMPTHKRPDFVPRALTYFLGQTYPSTELIVVDDWADGVADLMPADPRIRYIRLAARATIGAKRNLACEQARGSIIAHWDDDAHSIADFHSADDLPSHSCREVAAAAT